MQFNENQTVEKRISIIHGCLQPSFPCSSLLWRRKSLGYGFHHAMERSIAHENESVYNGADIIWRNKWIRVHIALEKGSKQTTPWDRTNNCWLFRSLH